MQVIDVTGRFLSSETVNGGVNKSINLPRKHLYAQTHQWRELQGPVDDGEMIEGKQIQLKKVGVFTFFNKISYLCRL